MLNITYSQYELETFFLILIRITSFIYIAPFFGQTNTPQRIRLGLGLFLSFHVYMLLPAQSLSYATTTDYAILVIKEAVTGTLIGFSVYIVWSVILFAGHIIDMEIGLSMATIFDPQTKTQITISGQFYQTIFMLIFIATGMYWYLLTALVDSFTAVPLGNIHVRLSLMTMLTDLIGQYFIIGFRIALPVFACSFLVNIVLGIMTKIAPQIHMFSVGMQLKILAGLFVMFITVAALPNIANYLLDQMKEVLGMVIQNLSP